jgi:molybdopterin converting factor small subunit
VVPPTRVAADSQSAHEHHLQTVCLVLVNGKYIKPEDRDTTTLLEGDVLAIWPPVAGG